MGQATILYPLLARVTMVCSLLIGATATAPLGKGAGPAGAGGGSRGRREYTLVMTREGNPGGGPRGARGALEDVVAVRGAGRARAPGARRKTPMWPRVAREVSTWAVARLPEAPGGAPGVLGARRAGGT